MMTYFAIVFLCAIILLFLLVRIHVDIEYQREDWDDYLVLSVYTLWGTIKRKYEIPLIDVDQKGIRLKRIKEVGKKEKDIEEKKTLDRFQDMIDRYGRMSGVLLEYKPLLGSVFCYVKAKLKLERLELDVKLGLEDAAHTGILTGAVWALAGSVTSYMENSFRVSKKSVNVSPVFNCCILRIDFHCIFQIKMTHIIIMLIKFVPMLKAYKWKTGGDMYERSSD